jgi:SpoVK/Ycf46/Vps4 family AAA+-type ATPase
MACEQRLWQRMLGEWGLGRRIAPGFTSLFHGPPGTGKTLSACLLGRRCGREVWRVDLSRWSASTSARPRRTWRACSTLAETRGWILFFDEADALFGKRTGVSDAHDRYANQEVSYLLQRVEAFAGVVILASNLRQHRRGLSCGASSRWCLCAATPA